MQKIVQFIKNNYNKIFIGSIILYVLIIFVFLIIKYNNFQYNALDLGIFNQVSFNSINGNLFYFTIHPHSYLGDHFALFLIFLLPFYKLFSSPLCLLFLQTLIIALCAIPIRLIAKHALNKSWALIIPLLWLINPLVINMNFFEFHLLPFGLFLLLFTIYFYLKKRFNLFLLFTLLSLTVREDIAIVIFMFSILALIEKRKIKWIIWPVVLSMGWFVLAQNIIQKFNPTGGYKFIAYYNWIGGNSLLEIFENYLIHPWQTIAHIFSLNNIIMALALLMPFGFIPILKPKYLLLALGPFLQFALLKNYGGYTVLATHYACLFLPALILSFIYALKKIYSPIQIKESKFIKFLKHNKTLIITIIIISSSYSLFTLSPLAINAKNKEPQYNQKIEKEICKELLNYIPLNEPVASSIEFIPQLSNRAKIYPLGYAWMGYKQLSYIPYELPNDVEYIICDFDEILNYNIQYIQNKEETTYKNSYLNWQKIFAKNNMALLKIIDTYSIWKFNPNLEKSSEKYQNPLYEIKNIDKEINIINKKYQDINQEIIFLGWDKLEKTELNQLKTTAIQTMPIALYFQKRNGVEIKDNYQLQLTLIPKNKSISEYTKIYPLTYGFYPSSKWQNKEIIKTNYWFLIPPKFYAEDFALKLNIINAQGTFTLGQNRTLIRDFPKKDILQPNLDIDY